MIPKSTIHFAPQRVEDVVFASEETQNYFLGLATKKRADDLLLYGPPGSGKSTLAKLVPPMLEPDLPKGAVINFDCCEYRSIDDVQTRLARPILLYPHGERHYAILEEADALSRDALASLKTAMDKASHQAVFIFVTNNVDRINEAIRSRCRELYIGHDPPDRWLPRVRSIVFSATGKHVPDEALLNIIRSAKDGRAIMRCCADLIDKINGQ